MPGEGEGRLIEAARTFRRLCDENGVDIVCLQPFMHYEGLRNRKRHAERIDEMKVWIQLVAILKTNMIAIPSSFLPADETSGDFDLIVSDLRTLVDLAPHIRFSYEALCWGTHINTWESAWKVVQAVDRDNFGLCLDTFNMAGKMYADPASSTGKTRQADENIAQSLKRLQAIDVKKIFFLQIVDAEKLESPLTPSHELFDPMQPTRMSWSRNCRLFYGEQDRGAYLPIKEITQTIVDMGYSGPTSAELFNACLTNASDEVPSELAERAAKSFNKLSEDLDSRQRNGRQSQECSLIADRT